MFRFGGGGGGGGGGIDFIMFLYELSVRDGIDWEFLSLKGRRAEELAIIDCCLFCIPSVEKRTSLRALILGYRVLEPLFSLVISLVDRLYNLEISVLL